MTDVSDRSQPICEECEVVMMVVYEDEVESIYECPCCHKEAEATHGGADDE